MDMIDQLKELASRIRKVKDSLQTEEATKNALIMPFIKILGYDVFNPAEVTPELTADVGLKRGEKVDYAILKDGQPIILIECKKSENELNRNHASQLVRYFHVTEARFAVLTNGITYQFYTDLENSNKMDSKPFFEFNILEFRDQHVEELKKFTKSSFDVDEILNTANELKYTRAIQNVLAEWMVNPSDEFIKAICGEVFIGRRITTGIKEQFSELTKKAFHQLIGERINDRLKIAMAPTDAERKTINQTPPDEETSDTEIITTEDELEGFRIIRAILREIANPNRIFLRDAKTYCAILFDNNNRRPICRLRFNNPSRLAIGVFNGKEENIFQISDLTEIYNYASQLKEAVSSYIKPDLTLVGSEDNQGQA